MFKRARWAAFIAAAAALFALVAALIVFSVWMVAEALSAGAPAPWSALIALFGVFFAPAWITAILAFWHLRRFRRTGHRSAMVETGVVFISALSGLFAASVFLGAS